MTTKMTDYSFELYAEHLLALTRHQFNKFRQVDMIRITDVSKSTPLEATTPMTTFSGHIKGSIASESHSALNNFRRGTRRDASAYPIFKNGLYYNNFQRSFLAIIKAHGLDEVADQTLTLTMEINMTSNSSKKNNPLHILY